MSIAAPYLWTLLLVVIVTAASFYWGFVYRERSAFLRVVFQYRTRGLFVALVVLVLPVAAFAVLGALRVQPEIAEFIEPYPGVDQATWLPDAVQDEERRLFVVTTADSPRSVIHFYRDPEHRPGWSLVAESEASFIWRPMSKTWSSRLRAQRGRKPSLTCCATGTERPLRRNESRRGP